MWNLMGIYLIILCVCALLLREKHYVTHALLGFYTGYMGSFTVINQIVPRGGKTR